MGIYLSRIRAFLRFAKSPDVYKKELEGVNTEILEVEQKKAKLEYQYYLITEFIVSYSRLLYLIVSVIFFFSTLPSTLVEYLLFCGPVVIFYVLVSSLKKLLKWYFDNEIKRNGEKLTKLQFRKNRILSEVEERVKFKDAKNILEEYSPDKKIQNKYVEKKDMKLESLLRRMPVVEKVVKYVLSEETKNALICRYCKYHNGMALEEEFNHISFCCCKCLKFNPSKAGTVSTLKEE